MSKLIETMQVAGAAPNVLAAHNMAWEGLESVLGTDPAPAWDMRGIQHVVDPDIGGSVGVRFQAEFARNPEYEAVAS